jgi:DNA helicase-2/ATP-dependent DNA helicase PcrA
MAVAQAVLRGASTLADTIATRPDGPLPRINVFESDNAEARGVARAVRDAHGPSTRWADQAILVRTNAQIPILEEALRKAQIPFRTRGGGLLRLPEARSIVRGLERSNRPLAVTITDLSSPPVDEDDSATEGDAPDTRQTIVDAIVRLAYEYLSIDPGATGAAFSSWLQTTTGGDEVDDRTDAIDVATFHAAKGLEWPHVHIVGFAEGLLPISYASTFEAVDEERRLAYVGITRAARTLSLSWSRGQGRTARNPSRFLAEIGTRTLRAAGASSTPGARKPRSESPTAAAGRERQRPRG